MEVSCELHASAALSMDKEPPGTYWIEDWVGLRAGLGIMKKKFLPLPGIEPGTPARSQSLYRLSYLGTLHG
jgi:hypothetical protein